MALDASVEEDVVIGEGSKVWGRTQIRRGARIGEHSVIGRGCFVDAGVVIGAFCKVQNNALIYWPAQIADGVFIGPAAILTNDKNPRAINRDGHLKGTSDWRPSGVVVGRGASIGAGAVCIAPLTIGEYAMVGAGSVVTSDVKPHAMVVGAPARHFAWVGHAGVALEAHDGVLRCPETGRQYRETEVGLLETEGVDF